MRRKETLVLFAVICFLFTLSIFYSLGAFSNNTGKDVENMNLKKMLGMTPEELYDKLVFLDKDNRVLSHEVRKLQKLVKGYQTLEREAKLAAQGGEQHQNDENVDNKNTNANKGKYCYVYTLGLKKGVYTRSNGDGRYVDALLVGAQGVRSTGSKHPVVFIKTGFNFEDVYEADKWEKERERLNIKVIDVSQQWADLQRKIDPKDGPLSHHWLKILLWEVLTDYDKCIYLDVDIVQLENYDPLFEWRANRKQQTLQEGQVGACTDPVMELHTFWNKATHEDRNHNFNSGMMLFKPSHKTFNQLVEYCHENYDESSYQFEQGILNQYFKNDWVQLPLAYNVFNTFLSSGLGGTAVNHVHGVHFVGAGSNFKPWGKGDGSCTPTDHCNKWTENRAKLQI